MDVDWLEVIYNHIAFMLVVYSHLRANRPRPVKRVWVHQINQTKIEKSLANQFQQLAIKNYPIVFINNWRWRLEHLNICYSGYIAIYICYSGYIAIFYDSGYSIKNQDTQMKASIDPETRPSVALYHLVKISHIIAIAYEYALGMQTVFDIRNYTTAAIWELLQPVCLKSLHLTKKCVGFQKGWLAFQHSPVEQNILC